MCYHSNGDDVISVNNFQLLEDCSIYVVQFLSSNKKSLFKKLNLNNNFVIFQKLYWATLSMTWTIIYYFTDALGLVDIILSCRCSVYFVHCPRKDDKYQPNICPSKQNNYLQVCRQTNKKTATDWEGYCYLKNISRTWMFRAKALRSVDRENDMSFYSSEYKNKTKHNKKIKNRSDGFSQNKL